MNSNIVTLSPDDIPGANLCQPYEKHRVLAYASCYFVEELRCKMLTHSHTRDLVDISFGKMLRANMTISSSGVSNTCAALFLDSLGN